MTFTNNLKVQVDTPVWEWLRAAPVITAAAMAMTDLKYKGARYMYYLSLGSLYRYDTYTDGWMQLASALITPVTILALEGAPQCGYYGRVIATGPSSSKTQIAALTGDTLLGYKIMITSGKGAGQERTITDVETQVVHEYGNTTTGAVTSITDTNAGILKRNWATNQWRDYQVRVTHGTGSTQIRKILSNTSTVLTVSDYNWAAIDQAFYCPFTTTPAAGSLYQIESSIITVDSAWTTEPDNTSRFVVKSGGLWALSSFATTPFYSFQYYDCAADIWYTKSCFLTLLNQLVAGLGTDVSLAIMREFDTSLISGTLSGPSSGGIYNSGNGTLANYMAVDSSKSLTQGRYSNYRLNVTETATGIVQKRTILYNDATRIWVTNKWEKVFSTPSDFTYTINMDDDKIYIIGGGLSTMYQYSIDKDIWSTSKIYDFGVARGFCAQVKSGVYNSGKAIGIASANRITGGILTASVGSGGTGYRVDDLLTVAGGVGSGGIVRVTAITPSTGAVLSVSLEQTGTTSYSAGTVATTGGSGNSGCTVAITVGAIATYTPVIGSHPIKLGDIVTVTGDTSAGNYYNVSSATVIGVTSTTFSCATNASVAASATFNAQSATVIYDYAQNWTANEHKNKYVLIAAIQSGGQGVTTQCRKIASNNETSLTVTGNLTAAVNGTSRYIIFDPRVFGTDDSFKGDLARGGLLSVCTGIDGGATAKTSLSDSTKNWILNYWTGVAARKIRVLVGPNMGSEIVLTSNSANTLYFGAQASEMTADTLYCIMDNYGVASGSGSTTTVVDNTQNYISGQHVGKRFKIMAVNTDAANHGFEVPITVSATTTLTTSSTLTSTVAGTSYSILNLPTRGAACQLIWIFNPSNGDGITSDAASTGRYLISFRGGATNEIDKYDMATEIWDILSTSPQLTTFTTGAMYAYDHMDRIYIASENATALMTGRVIYYDFVKNRMEQGGQAPYGFGTGVLSNRMEILETVDGLKYLYLMRNTDSVFWRVLIYW